MPPQFSLWALSALVIAAVLATFFRRSENKKSQQVKDLRSKIDAIDEDLDAVEDLAMSYFLSGPNDAEAQKNALQIKAKIKRIAERVNSVHVDPALTKSSRGASVLTKLMHFRQAVTLEDFDSAERKPLTARDPKFEKISRCASELKRALESIYFDNQ